MRTGSFRGKNTHWETKGLCDKPVLWGAQSDILPAPGLCFQPLLLCTKTSKERNHNTGALNVSAATFLLGSNSFQRTDQVFVFCSDFHKAIAAGRPAVVGSAKNANSQTHFCLLSPLLCVLFSLSWAFLVLIFFPHQRSSRNKTGEAGTGWRGVGQCHPGFPVSGNSFVLGLQLSCWIPAPAGQSDSRECMWGLLLGCLSCAKCCVFQPCPRSLTKLCCQNLPPSSFWALFCEISAKASLSSATCSITCLQHSNFVFKTPCKYSYCYCCPFPHNFVLSCAMNSLKNNMCATTKWPQSWTS